MSKPPEIETAEYEFLISPSAGETNQPKPASTDVRADVGAVSHTGQGPLAQRGPFLVSRVSRQQEILQTNMPPDSLPEYTGEDGYLFIVADGMGGMAAGEVASRLAISTSLKLFQRSERWGFRVNHREARELFDRISRDLREIDRTLTEQSAADRRLLGMGTTLTAAYSMGDRPVHHPPRRLAGVPPPRRRPAAAHQGPHRGPGDGRRRLHPPA